eukprot:Rmarinus@m.18296
MLESWLLFGIVGNVLSTVCCVLGNKYLSTELGFEFMMTLSGIHFLLTAIGTRVIAKVAKVKRTPNPPGVLEILPLCIFTTGSVGLMNLNLLHNSVGFYMLSKLCCIPCTLVLEWYLSKKTNVLGHKGRFTNCSDRRWDSYRHRCAVQSDGISVCRCCCPRHRPLSNINRPHNQAIRYSPPSTSSRNLADPSPPLHSPRPDV